MSETARPDTSVLDFLREQFARVNARLDRIETKLDEVIFRLGALERGIAALKVDFAGMQLRLDTMSGRKEFVG